VQVTSLSEKESTERRFLQQNKSDTTVNATYLNRYHNTSHNDIITVIYARVSSTGIVIYVVVTETLSPKPHLLNLASFRSSAAETKASLD